MTNDEPYRWWGFRVREPRGPRLGPLTRPEAVILGVLLAIPLEAAWLAWLLLSGVASFSLGSAVLTPLMLLASPIGLGILVPVSICDALGISPLMTLARERGDLRTWDRWIVLAGVACGVCLVANPFRVMSVTAAMLAFSATAGSFGLGFIQQQVTSVARRRSGLPAWLQARVEADRERLSTPEPEARTVLAFNTGSGRAHRVGVAISDNLLNKLRHINAKHAGRLWKSDPAVVVLADRPPVDTDATQALQTLCGQLAAAAEADGLTRLELANQVLALVQREVSYQFDKDSTASFAGGPFDEYGRFALETVNDRVGDCECTSILCATLLSHLGFRTALILADVVHSPERVSGHAMVGVDLREALPPGSDGLLEEVTSSGGRRFVCGETAVDGAVVAFGVLPLSLRHEVRVTRVVPIEA